MSGRRNPTKERRRARVARSTLARVDWQTADFTQRYGKAQTPRQRLSIAAQALMGAAAPGAHQPDQDTADRLVERVTENVIDALRELHSAQRATADEVLAKEQRRQARAAERRSRHATTPQPPVAAAS